MRFYKSVIEHKGKLLVRGIHDGKDYKDKIDFAPTLYALTQQETEYKNLQGQFLKPITFKNIDAARRFRREVATQNSPVYGLERYHYQYIGQQHPGDIEWSKDLIKIFTVDSQNPKTP